MKGPVSFTESGLTAGFSFFFTTGLHTATPYSKPLSVRRLDSTTNRSELLGVALRLLWVWPQVKPYTPWH